MTAIVPLKQRPLPTTEWAAHDGAPVSARIRARVLQAKRRFHANDHFCMHWRGVRDSDSKMVNSVMRGAFLAEPALRREFLSLLNLKS